MHRTQPLELARLQRHRRVVAQPRPLLAGEDAVGIILLFGGPDIHELPLSAQSRLRDAFSSSPDIDVRCASAASTSSSLTPRAFNSTSR